jgi:hypothetical protein
MNLGTMGSGPEAGEGSVASAIYIEELKAGPVERLNDHLTEPAKDFVPELVIRFHAGADCLAIETQAVNRAEGPAVEHPAIGGKQPRPANDFPGTDCLNDAGTSGSDVQFDSHVPIVEHQEAIGGAPLSEQEAIRLDVKWAGNRDQELEVIIGNPREEWVLGEHLLR